jgi:serine/threonine-protein kinase HipA
VLAQGRRVGLVTMDTAGRFAMMYDDEWRHAANPTPLSLSLPLTRITHGDAAVRSFLSGLLPDNERVLDRWARSFQVSAGNPVAMLRRIGADCAGAAEFALPEQEDDARAGSGGVRWLAEDEVAGHLGRLRQDPTAWHVTEPGRFSLAGAQPKTALYHDPETGRWGEPWGAVPTTHILKPIDDDLNEHLCLRAASGLGLRTALSRVVRFGAELAVVVQRYDRTRTPGPGVTRVHQEDLGQALGRPPTAKYQSDGGPNPEQIIELLRRSSLHPEVAVDNVDRFVDALAFNWIIAGNDAHAKNYSVLLTGAEVRLAPLYDLGSALAVDDLYLPRLKLAMKVGGEYGVEAIAGRHWRRLALAADLDEDALIARIDDLADRTPAAFAAAADPDLGDGRGDRPARLVDRVTTRAKQCRESLHR